MVVSESIHEWNPYTVYLILKHVGRRVSLLLGNRLPFVTETPLKVLKRSLKEGLIIFNYLRVRFLFVRESRGSVTVHRPEVPPIKRWTNTQCKGSRYRPFIGKSKRLTSRSTQKDWETSKKEHFRK